MNTDASETSASSNPVQKSTPAGNGTKRGKPKRTTIRPNIPFSEKRCSGVIKHLGLGGMRTESVRDLVCSRLEQISDDDFFAVLKACGQNAAPDVQKASTQDASPE